MALAIEKDKLRPEYEKGTRRGLKENTAFCKIFALQKARIRLMDFRCVEEAHPVRQTLLEVYCAITLRTRYNDFGTH